MTRDQLLRYAMYAAQWAAVILAVRGYNRRRPGSELPRAYWIVMGLLAVLQLYGERWPR